jgi:outer membrane protein
MRKTIYGAVAALALSAAGGSALAADLGALKAPPPPPPVFVDTYQPFQVRLKIGSLIPLDGTSTIRDAGSFNPALLALPTGGLVVPTFGLGAGPGGVVAGASTSISYSVIPMLDVAYYLTKNWAIEAICCVSHNHVQGIGTLAGSSLARTWVFPPSLIFQYHFTNFGAFQPYLGVGVNFTTFWGTRAGNNNWTLLAAPGSLAAPLVGANASFYSASISPSWGVVGQVGADYMFDEHWGVNLDVKYIMVEPNAHAWIAATTPLAPGLGVTYIPVNAAVKINPLVVSAGLTYRFGGGVVAPVLAKY